MSRRKIKAIQDQNDFRKLGLDHRIVNALARYGICNLWHLAEITDSELAKLQGIGPGTRKLLRDYLKREDMPGGDKDTISLMLSKELIRAIDDWCVAHSDSVTSRAETVRRLVVVALGLGRRFERGDEP
jgi:hypothetical protein